MAWLPDGEKISKICLFVLTECTNVTDTHTDRQWCPVNRQFGEDREVIRWRTVCNRQRWCKRRVISGYYEVKNMILVVICKINMSS